LDLPPQPHIPAFDHQHLFERDDRALRGELRISAKRRRPSYDQPGRQKWSAKGGGTPQVDNVEPMVGRPRLGHDPLHRPGTLSLTHGGGTTAEAKRTNKNIAPHRRTAHEESPERTSGVLNVDRTSEIAELRPGRLRQRPGRLEAT